MGALVLVFVILGIVWGICLTVGIVLTALVKSNNIGQIEIKDTEYIDYSTLNYHARYDSNSCMNYFDGEYK